MAYQAQPPTMANSTVAPAAGGRRKGLVVLGILLMVVGVAAGVVLYVTSSSKLDKAVKDLARAPVGCTTTLAFDKTGTFTIFVETKGKIGSNEGDDCPNGDASYSRTNDDLPVLDPLELRDSQNDIVPLTRKEGLTYSAAGFKGRSIDTVKITKAGNFRLTVVSPDSDFAIAIGNDPNADTDSLKTAGVAAAAAGLLLGAALLLIGLRRRAQPVPAGPAPWQPTYAPAYQTPPVYETPTYQTPSAYDAPPLAPPPPPPSFTPPPPPPPNDPGWGQQPQ